MLARRNSLKLDGHELLSTPLLIPSFSSKGFPHVNRLVEELSEFLTRSALISAYDVGHGYLSQRTVTGLRSAVELVFLDSGGYEAGRDYDLSDAYRTNHDPDPWNLAKYRAELNSWRDTRPSVIISFDSPRKRMSLRAQLDALLALPHRKQSLRELLLKPERPGERFLSIERLEKFAKHLSAVDIIGVTEKEIGAGYLDRMVNIARLRRALDQADIRKPIHIFGSLDAISCCLYFLSGAEIFDGLSWLRFGFHSGQTLYLASLAFEEINGIWNIHRSDEDLATRTWTQNYYYIQNLETQMNNYLNGDGFGAFRFIGPRLEQAVKDLEGRLRRKI